MFMLCTCYVVLCCVRCACFCLISLVAVRLISFRFVYVEFVSFRRVVLSCGVVRCVVVFVWLCVGVYVGGLCCCVLMCLSCC